MIPRSLWKKEKKKSPGVNVDGRAARKKRLPGALCHFPWIFSILPLSCRFCISSDKTAPRPHFNAGNRGESWKIDRLGVPCHVQLERRRQHGLCGIEFTAPHIGSGQLSWTVVLLSWPTEGRRGGTSPVERRRQHGLCGIEFMAPHIGSGQLSWTVVLAYRRSPRGNITG